VSVRDTPAAGTSSPNPVLAGMGDGLALAAARATLASHARKPGGGAAPEPPAHSAPTTHRNQGTSTKQ
jgi:hypothetical protein